MSQSQAELNRGRVKVGDLKEVSKQELLELLDYFPGGKTLVWDNALTKSMELIAGFSLLKEHQANIPKMYVVFIYLKLS